jgi:putative OPT family oligopeptide transporter
MENAPDDPERRWLTDVYQRGARQLTVRAVVTGMLLGGVMCLSNLYIVLKTGWSFGVTITACILAFAIFRLLRAARLVRTDFGVLENNAMASVASAAGYMTGGGNMAALPALLMLGGARPGTLVMMVWLAVIAALGVFAAIPIKRQLINIEALPFPTGTATAETLRSLHGQGAGATGKARLLGGAALFGALIAFLRDARFAFLPFHLPAKLGLPFTLRGRPAGDWTLGLDGSLLLVGAGALMSWKTGWSLLLGAVVGYGFVAPAMFDRGLVAAVSYREIVRFMVWPGAACLVASALLSFAFSWRSLARSFRGLGAALRRRAGTADPLAAVECPVWWFPAGFLVLSPLVVGLMRALFGIPLAAGIVAIPLAFVMGIVAARVTGETDTTPTKALGPVTQLCYGALLPGNLAANLMGANVTGGVGLHAADLLTDLKAGYLLGANPRQQAVAQLFGVLAGALMVVPVFNLLVPSADVLGTEALPAPSALVWAGVAKVLVTGSAAVPPEARWAALAGALAGVMMVLAERWAPPRVKSFIPSASGVGLALVLPGANSIAMFLGAFLAQLLRWRPALAERVVLPVSSGLIAGESLMGIGLAILAALHFM